MTEPLPEESLPQAVEPAGPAGALAPVSHALRDAGVLALQTWRVARGTRPLLKLLASEEDSTPQELRQAIDLLFKQLYAHPLTRQSERITGFLRQRRLIPNEQSTEDLIRFVVDQLVARSPVEIPEPLIDEFWHFFDELFSSPELKGLGEMSLDMVRPGVGVYGLYPSQYVSRSLNLRPVLSLKSRVTRLTAIAPGDGVSYGRTWRANRPSVIALVMCGYGDGLPRLLSNRGSLLVRARRVPIVGRVCMDMCMADVTDVPDVAEGDEVVLIGRQGEAAITAAVTTRYE